ncbi:MAG TPA: site-specific recombinase [Streptosporangiaceae bacterium]|nr:site-specific recombinase [Streptosporangiaceae bacterium]
MRTPMRPPDAGVIATRPGPAPGPDPEPAPVEYAVAVDRYLAEASLGAASRRVYRISLTSWAWALVGRRPPCGTGRRGAVPPVVPLALLNSDEAGLRLADALADRAGATDPRTVNRELSALRSAVGWWQDQRWISADPTAGLRNLTGRLAPLPALTSGQVDELFRTRISLREQALWRIIYDSGAHIEDVLGLDAGRLDLTGRGAPIGASPHGRYGWIRWRDGTGQLLDWLLAGRSCGPVFLTQRRAPAGAAPADVCPVTGRARMSYRRAAEIFAVVTRPLDPHGRGWTLGQLRQAGLEAGADAG